MLRSILIALMVLAAGSAAVLFAQDSTSEAPIQAIVSGTTHSSKRMPDGKEWTTDNLKVSTAQQWSASPIPQTPPPPPRQCAVGPPVVASGLDGTLHEGALSRHAWSSGHESSHRRKIEFTSASST